MRPLHVLPVSFGCLVLSVLLLAPVGPARAQEAPPTTGTAVEMDAGVLESAVVELDGRPLFRVRGTTGFPAAARAKVIESRIRAFASGRTLSTDSIAVEHLSDRSNLTASGLTLASIFDFDGILEGLPRRILAERARSSLVAAVGEYRSSRSRPVLIRHTLWALAATLLALVILIGIARGHRRVSAVVEGRIKTRMDRIEKRSFNVIETRHMWMGLKGAISAGWTILVVVILYFWLNGVLGLFPWTRSLSQRLTSLLVDPIVTLAGLFLEKIPDLMFLAVIVLLARYVLKITRLFFQGIDQRSIVIRNFDQDWAMPTYRLVRLMILALTAVLAYPYVPGSGSAAFKGLSIFIGVVFSIGSSSFVANMVAGTTLTYRRAFKVGDRVRIQDVLGDVIEIRVQATHIRSIKNEEVTIPNSVILSSPVINYSALARSRGLILHTEVGIGYETPWRQVEAMLKLAADRVPALLKDPPPFVLQKELGDFAVTYEINAFTDTPGETARSYSSLHQNILDVFNEYRVQIMTPAYEGDPEAPKVVARDRWHAAPAPPGGGV